MCEIMTKKGSIFQLPQRLTDFNLVIVMSPLLLFLPWKVSKDLEFSLVLVFHILVLSIEQSIEQSDHCALEMFVFLEEEREYFFNTLCWENLQRE